MYLFQNLISSPLCVCLYLDQFFKPFNFLPFQLSSHIKGALHPALQKNWTIAAVFLRQVQKKPLYIAYCGLFLDSRCTQDLLRHFLGPPLWYSFLWHPTTTGHKPSPYICFSGDNVDIVALQTPAAINTSFCVDTIAVVEKNRRNMLSIAAVCMTATIGILFAVLLLDIVAVWTIAINL